MAIQTNFSEYLLPNSMMQAVLTDDFYHSREQFAEIFKQVRDVSYKFFDVDLSAKVRGLLPIASCNCL
jgi:hypothetical protein